MKITFLSDNKTENPMCIAEWGLSILVESQGCKVLFDVGASSVFAQNAKALGVDLKEVDAVAISHGHYDHTEGMEEFCKCNDTAPIYIHKEALKEAFGTDENGNIEKYNCGIRWSESFIKSIRERFVLTEGITKINDNMILVGNIPLMKEYPMTEKFYRKDEIERDKLVEDSMDHEQFLVVKEEKGISIISGCSHKGVLSIINYAKNLFPHEKVLVFIGGMHLYPLSDEERKTVVDSICDVEMEYLFPVHCTGMEAMLMLKEREKERCIIASAGDSYEC